jgi:hypothetical protein
MTFAINSCKNQFNNLISNKINDPKILVEKYLACKTWQERLLYVLDSTNVKALMEKHYSKADLTNPPKIKDIQQNPKGFNTKLTDSILIMKGTFDTEIYEQFIYYIVKTKEGLKIDWLSSIGYNTFSLNVYQATKPTDVKIFRMNCKLSDYYNFGYINSSDQFYSIECITNDNESPSMIHGYVLKNSVDGIKIFDILKDGESHKMSLALKYDFRSEQSSDIVAIKKFMTEGWCYDTNSKTVSSEVLLDYLVNSDGTDMAEYQNYPDKIEARGQLTKSIKSYFEKENFIIETKQLFQNHIVAHTLDYCTLTDDCLAVIKEEMKIGIVSEEGLETLPKTLIKFPVENKIVKWNYTDKRDGTYFSYSAEFAMIEFNGKNIKAIKVTEKNTALKTLTIYRYYLKDIGLYKECFKDENGKETTTSILV